MPNLITATLVRAAAFCPRRPFMDRHRDPADAREPAAQRYAQVAGQAFERITERRSPLLRKAATPPGHLTREERAVWTHAAMMRGEAVIAQGVLHGGSWLGKPDWLVREAGDSVFGTWRYRVIDAKSTANLDRTHVLPVIFYGMLLDRVQRTNSKEVEIRTPTGNAKRPIAQNKRHVLALIETIEHVDDRNGDPGPRLASRCRACRWEDACQRDARDEMNLSLVAGLPSGAIDALAARGIRTYQELLQAPEALLRSVGKTKKFPPLPLLRARARALVEQKPTLVGSPPLRAGARALVDIETEGTVNGIDAFLFGLMTSDGTHRRYSASYASSPDERRAAWVAFVRMLQDLDPGLPIYHYGPYDRSVASKLALHFNCGADVAERLVDVAAITRTNAAFPVRSYSLKKVSRFLGASWRGQLDGMFIGSEWRESTRDQTKSLAFRSKVEQYNENDLIALDLLVSWLSDDNARGDKAIVQEPLDDFDGFGLVEEAAQWEPFDFERDDVGET